MLNSQGGEDSLEEASPAVPEGSTQMNRTASRRQGPRLGLHSDRGIPTQRRVSNPLHRGADPAHSGKAAFRQLPLALRSSRPPHRGPLRWPRRCRQREHLGDARLCQLCRRIPRDGTSHWRAWGTGPEECGSRLAIRSPRIDGLTSLTCRSGSRTACTHGGKYSTSLLTYRIRSCPAEVEAEDRVNVLAAPGCSPYTLRPDPG